MTRLFGTDGVRGLANEALTASPALKLGAAAATVLTKDRGSEKRRPIALIGRDPRVSGEMLAAAMAAGMASKGVDVLRVDTDDRVRNMHHAGAVAAPPGGAARGHMFAKHLRGQIPDKSRTNPGQIPDK